MDPKSALDQAKTASTQGDKPRARSIIREIIKQEPNNEEALLLFADLAQRKEDAIYVIEQLLKLNPNNEVARKRLETLRPTESPPAPPEAVQNRASKEEKAARNKEEKIKIEKKHLEAHEVTKPAEVLQDQAAGLKPCPSCAKMIKEAAIYCRFCGRDLRPPQSAPEPPQCPPTAPPNVLGREPAGEQIPVGRVASTAGSLMQIYVSKQGNQFGPYGLDQIKRMISEGAFQTSDSAWFEGCSGWIPLSKIPGISLTPPMPPPPTMTIISAGAIAYGGFWIRVVASLADTVVLVIPNQLIVFLYTTLYGGEGVIYSLIFQSLLWWIYCAALESSQWRATIGKKICGLKVVDYNGNRISFGRASGRYFSRVLSGIILCIGFIMVGLTERKQGLHDMIAGTLVIRT